jgi:DNA-binding PadR family transcriptional regulator
MTLLGLLDHEPSHGYDLKHVYDRFFGRQKPISFGQVYSTLSRLARDGKVEAGEAEPGGGPDRRPFVITAVGHDEFEAWLIEPVPAEPTLQTLLFTKVVLALMLGKNAEEYLEVQRTEHVRRMRELTEVKRTGPIVDVLLADHGLYHLEADLRWIDNTSLRLDSLRETVTAP